MPEFEHRFASDRRVDRADRLRAGRATKADVAAIAPDDVVAATIGNLVGQFWIGKRRPSEQRDIDLVAFECMLGDFGALDAAHAHDGQPRMAPHLVGHVEPLAFRVARDHRKAVEGFIDADRQGYRVDPRCLESLDDFDGLRNGDPLGHEFLGTDANAKGEIRRARCADAAHDVEQEPHAVLERAAVDIGALV